MKELPKWVTEKIEAEWGEWPSNYRDAAEFGARAVLERVEGTEKEKERLIGEVVKRNELLIRAGRIAKELDDRESEYYPKSQFTATRSFIKDLNTLFGRKSK